MTHDRADNFGLAAEGENWPVRGKPAFLKDLPDTMVFSEKVFIALSFVFGNDHNDQVSLAIYKDDSLKDMHFGKRDFPIFAQEGLCSSLFLLKGGADPSRRDTMSKVYPGKASGVSCRFRREFSTDEGMDANL